MIEQTLCIIKPDVAMTLAPNIMIALLADYFAVVQCNRAPLTKAQAERLYEAHIGQSYYARNLDFMLSGPSVVMVLERENAIAQLRERLGPTDPMEARRIRAELRRPLRALYGTDLPRNALHASANARDAAREIGIFFPRERALDFNDLLRRRV